MDLLQFVDCQSQIIEAVSRCNDVVTVVSVARRQGSAFEIESFEQSAGVFPGFAIALHGADITAGRQVIRCQGGSRQIECIQLMIHQSNHLVFA